MTTYVSWIDETQKIIEARTIGGRKPDDLLIKLQFVLSQKADYLIWNPTDILFPIERIRKLDDNSPERQDLLNLLSQSLIKGDLKLFFVIQKSQHPVFEEMRKLYALYKIEHLVHFVASIEEVYDIIARQ